MTFFWILGIEKINAFAQNHKLLLNYYDSLFSCSCLVSTEKPSKFKSKIMLK